MNQEFTKKPWGFELLWAKTDNYAGKIITIFPEQRLSLQFHKKKSETIYVLSGVLKLDLKLGEELYSKQLFPGESYHIAPDTIHRFCCGGEAPVSLVEVSTPELDDVVRTQDDYGRG